MLDSRSVKSQLGEYSLVQLVTRLGDYELVSDALSGDQTLGRHFSGMVETRHGNALVDFVAVAESFASSRLLTLHSEITDRSVFNWDARKKSWKKLESIDLSLLPGWSALMGFIEVRNALQHGLGYLTDHQLARREELLKFIAAAGVHVSGDRVEVRVSDVRECYEIVRDFIIALDSAAPVE